MKRTDIVVVGGGPAGLTAAIYAQRAGKSCVVFEKDVTGGMINNSDKVENIPGFSEVNGSVFGERLTTQAENCGAEIVYEEVFQVSYIELYNLFEVVAETESYVAKVVIIATGTKHNTLGLEHEKDFIGNGIHFCALCDGAFYKDKTVCVVGGGNSAMTESLYLSNICKEITILQNLEALTGDKVLVDRIGNTNNINIVTNCNIKEYVVDQSILTGIKYTVNNVENTALCDGVFLAIGLSPNKDITNGLIEYEHGYAKHSKIEGLLFAGDCSAENDVKQVVTACSSGAIAATKACSYIEKFN